MDIIKVLKSKWPRAYEKEDLGANFWGEDSYVQIHYSLFIISSYWNLVNWTNIILWCNRNLSFKTKLWMMKSPYKVTARRAFHQNRSRLCTSKELKTWTKTISIILLKNNIISGISSNEMKPKVLSDWNLMDLTQAFWLLGLVHVTSIKLLRESYQIDLAKKYKVIKLFTN